MTAGSASSLTATILWKQAGSSFGKNLSLVSTTGSGAGVGFGGMDLYSDASYAIFYSTTFSPGSSPYHHDLRIRVEKVE